MNSLILEENCPFERQTLSGESGFVSPPKLSDFIRFIELKIMISKSWNVTVQIKKNTADTSQKICFEEDPFKLLGS